MYVHTIIGTAVTRQYRLKRITNWLPPTCLLYAKLFDRSAYELAKARTEVRHMVSYGPEKSQVCQFQSVCVSSYLSPNVY